MLWVLLPKVYCPVGPTPEFATVSGTSPSGTAALSHEAGGTYGLDGLPTVHVPPTGSQLPDPKLRVWKFTVV